MIRSQIYSPIDRLRSSGSQLVLSNDSTDQSLSGNLGALKLRGGNNTISMDLWMGAAQGGATVGNVLSFNARTVNVGTSLARAIQAQITYDTTASYSGAAHTCGNFEIAQANSSVSYTNNTSKILNLIFTAASLGTGPNTFTEVGGIRTTMNVPGGSGTTITDSYGHRISWPTILVAGAWTNAYTERLMFPTFGGTIRRGCWVDPSTTVNYGTEATNTEAFFAGALPRGTAQRVGYYASGATTGTPTDVYGFYLGTAHVVGTNRYGFRAIGATTGTPTLSIGFYADAHSVGTTKWSFYGNDGSFFTGITMADASDIVINTGTGTKIGTATNQLIGIWNATPVARPGAYTQTYSTADKTHAALTSATLTDSTGGTANTTVSAVAAGTDLTTNATINDNFADVTAQINALRVDLEDIKQLVNSVIDDFQSIGWLA